MKKLTSMLLAVLIGCSFSLSAFAQTTPMDGEDIPTGSVQAHLVGGSGARMSPNMGGGFAEYNTTSNWGRAKTYAEAWGKATYLYAKATVGADGVTAKSASRSNSYNGKTKGLSLYTDKITCPTTQGRYIITSHTVKGYHSNSTTLMTEDYTGEVDF